jgi:hypothetical protein
MLYLCNIVNILWCVSTILTFYEFVKFKKIVLEIDSEQYIYTIFIITQVQGSLFNF